MDVVEEIKRKVELVDFIGRVTRLQKAGRGFRGLCPFHTEKTPSFYVFPDRGSWRCFGSCGEGGDLFSFVQKRESLDFRGALRVLAAEAGVQLTAESSAKRSRADHLSGIMSAAVDFYQRCFREAGGEEARAYVFETRGLSPAVVETFRVGWAPAEWRLLRDHLSGRGYDERDAVAAGLLVESESGGQPYDRFRGRVIIPIADERGQYVAMGGRGIHSEEPKYLNSPQTDIFDKGRTLFALHSAIPAIRETGTVVVVEGYMDVMGPWQAGFTNVVATMGTSLTEHHVALLRRFGRRIVLAMDPDNAGLNAAERAGALVMGLDSPEGAARSARSAQTLTAGTDIDLRVAPLPAGKDPDQLAREDPEGWREAISGALPYAEFLLKRLMGPPVEGPVEARRVVDRLRPVLLAVADPVERAMYVQRIARQLGVAEAAVVERLRQGASAAPRRQGLAEEKAEGGHEEALLAFLVRYPELRPEFASVPEHLFTHAIDREVFRRWAHPGGEFAIDDAIEARRQWLANRRLPPLTERQAVAAVREKIREITRERVVLHQAAMSEQLSEAERSYGAGPVAETSNEAWRGRTPAADERDRAETAMETLQLGLSIHRREEPGRV
ncbi:MAG: DNA primase [Dehalococcoidia bacterium]